MAIVWLIGMMGAGKTTIAPLVATRLDSGWADTDRLVEARSGRDLQTIFSQGEDVFRREEAAAVRALLDEPIVVACGGGIVLDDELVTAIRSAGIVIWLDAPVEVLVERTGAGGERPLVAGDPVGALERLFEERRDKYEAAAHAVVSAMGTPDEVADRVVGAWSNLS
jgi:shikimate kinase